jgi:pyruvate-formate lyase-activating enzyme
VKIHLGGIYASLLPEHAKLSGADLVHVGLHYQAEKFVPAWDLIPQWKASILFASRGCIRRCGFCSVPKLEGRPHDLKFGIRDMIYPGHSRVILWDNNILGNQNWRAIFDELIEIGLDVDFNQGLDARCVTQEAAEKISKMKTAVIRLAYDFHGIGPYVKRAIEFLSEQGVRGRDVTVYVLFNYTDSPEDFFERIRDLLRWGAVSYPMRYEPLTSLEKNKYISPRWDAESLEKVADARRVIGYAGAFPPYKALVEKFENARNFNEAFHLRPVIRTFPMPTPSAELTEQGADHQQLTVAVRVKKPKYVGSKDWRHHDF